MEYLYAIILGIVEGLTEFIPVSSTGHLIATSSLLGLHSDFYKSFEVIIQLGAILAVCVKYWQKLFGVVCTLHTSNSQKFALNLIIAFLPAAIVGLCTYSYIKTYLFSPVTVAIMLIIGGIAFILIENYTANKGCKTAEVDDIPKLTALQIGLFQMLALIPGVSRSGATIMGSLMCGVGRKAAAEFSFFLAIPTMFAATIYDLYNSWGAINGDQLLILVVGFVTAFISALAVINWLINFVTNNGFKPFAYYRIVAGVAMLLYFV